MKKGDIFTTGELKYKVTKTGKKKEAQCIGTTNKKIKKLLIPSTIAEQNIKYNVVSVGGFANCKKLVSVTIGKNVTAFYNCPKLKKLSIQSTKLKKVGENAIKGTPKKMVLSVPKGKKKQYQKLFQ